MERIVNPIPVEPIAMRNAQAFVSRRPGPSGLEWVKVPVYPASGCGEQLAASRRGRRVTLSEAARRVGLSASDWSGLEQGRLQLSDAEWSTLLAAVRSWPERIV